MRRLPAALPGTPDAEPGGSGETDALCRSFAELLGVEEPISRDALRSIADDPTYARRLFACRGAPQMMTLMLAHPPPPEPTLGNRRIIAGAAAALARWAGAGFAKVPPEQAMRRLAACHVCPHLKTPPTLLQKLASAGADDGRVCTLCGCVVARKVHIATEHCPGRDDGDPTLTRWGEAAVAPSGRGAANPEQRSKAAPIVHPGW